MDPADPAFQAYVAQLVAAQLAITGAPTPPSVRSNLPRPRAPDAWRGDREDACDVETWLFGVDAFFRAANVTTDAERFSFLPTLLASNGQRWWMYLEQQARVGGLPVPTTWAAFARAITAQFQPVNSTENARAALCSIRQTTGVQAYAGRYRALLLQLPDISPADAMFRFINGLKSSVQVMVRLSNPTSLDAAISAAERVDVISYKPVARSTVSYGHGPTPMELGAMQDDDAGDMDSATCDNWNEEDEAEYQLAAVTMDRAASRRPPMPAVGGGRGAPPPPPRPGAPLTAAQKDYARANGLCWTCMKAGHTSAFCPTKASHPKGGRPPA